METAKAMMFAAGAPKEYWAEAVSTAVYLRNIAPMRTISEGSPYEAWYGRRHNLAHLRVWGCVAYARVPKETRRKLDANAQRYAFVGYTNSTKQYKLYDPVKRKVTLSRDVEFEERRSYFRFQDSEEARSGRIFYYFPTEPPNESKPDKGGTAGPSGSGGDVRMPQADDHWRDTPQASDSQGDTHQVMEPVTPACTPELPGSFVDAPEEQLGREQAE